jgi:hypothetical protein
MERPDFIVDLVKDCKVGVELGVSRGELSRNLLSRWSGKLYLVDAWRHIEGLVDVGNPDHNGHLDNMAHTFMNVYDFGDRAIIIRDLSVNASKLFQDESLDFIYIDAGHDKKSVNEDLNAWYPKIKKGGFMIGDDYFDALFHLKDVPNSNTLIEVKSTVDEFAKKINTKLNISDINHPALIGKPEEQLLKQWWVVK